MVQWFEKNRRILPWRTHASTYGRLVSEFMLQQTQVATVIPYFENWMRQFPSLEALAEAPEGEVLKAW
jgi:A/G-specific adenine glycosylase